MRTLDELATEISTLARHINATNHRFLLLIAEYDSATAGRTTARSPARIG